MSLFLLKVVRILNPIVFLAATPVFVLVIVGRWDWGLVTINLNPFERMGLLIILSLVCWGWFTFLGFVLKTHQARIEAAKKAQQIKNDDVES